MQTFFVEKEPDETTRKHIKTEPRECKHDGDIEKARRKEQKEKDVRCGDDPPRTERIAKTKNGIVKDAARNAATDADEQDEKLIPARHLKKRERSFAAPP